MEPMVTDYFNIQTGSWHPGLSDRVIQSVGDIGSPAHRAMCWNFVDQFVSDPTRSTRYPIIGKGHYSTVYDCRSVVVKVGRLRDTAGDKDGWPWFAQAAMDDPHEDVIQVYAMSYHHQDGFYVAVMKKYDRALSNEYVAIDEAVRMGTCGGASGGEYHSLSHWIRKHFTGWHACTDVHSANVLIERLRGHTVLADPFSMVPHATHNIRASGSVYVK